MDMSTISEYLKPELTILAVALFVLGVILKHTQKIKDNFIPVILTGVSIVLACLYVLGTEGVSATSIFTAIVQGIICVAVSVYVNQVYKQLTKSS